MSHSHSTPSAEKRGVCAIIVTHNRKELLRECLQALLAQSTPVARILVIDNASTDGTGELLRHEFSPPKCAHIEFVRLETNVGGAGGFHEGVRRGAEGAHEWLWLMDDDTIPKENALERLLEAWGRFPRERKPNVLTSKVIWQDGSVHWMNVPPTRLGDPEAAYLAAECGALLIRSATFVSVLIESRCVAEHGLPVADYFIWGEDVEYTGRILRHGLGVLVPTSVALHKTQKTYGPAQGTAARFYYFVRNGVWMLLWSKAWTPNERFKLALRLGRTVSGFLAHTASRAAGVRAVAVGLWDGLTTRPRR